MSDKIFSSGRTVDSVAYDLALALATRDGSANNPNMILTLIKMHLPECRQIAEKFYNEETPPPENDVNIKFIR